MNKKEILIERVRALEKGKNSDLVDDREWGWNKALHEVIEIIKASNLEAEDES